MSKLGRKIAMGSAARGINLIATAAASLLLMPFVVHKLGDRMYGVWALVATFVGYYGLMELGLSSAVSRHLSGALGSGDQEECNRVFNTALRIYGALSVAAMLLTVIIAGLAPSVLKNSTDSILFSKIILVVGASVALMFPTRIFKGVLEANLRFNWTAYFDLLSVAVRTVLVILALNAGYKVLALAWVTLLTSVLSAILYVYFSFRDVPFLRLDSRYWGRGTAAVLFSYGVYSLAANLADILRFQIDNMVVATFISIAAVTHYSIAGKMAEYFLALMLALMGVFNSVFSRQEGSRDFDGLKKTFFFASKVSVCASSFVGFGLIAWGKPFIVRWMGPAYLDAYPCLVALVIGMTTALWQAPSVSLLYAISKHKFLALSNTIEGVANLILSLVLVKKYGILGVALGTVFPMVISKLLIQPIYVCRVARLDYREYIQKAGKTILVAVGSLIIPFALSSKFAVPDYRMLLGVGLISLAFYLAVFVLVELSGEERNLLRKSIVPNLT
jgi:O-antigen/teichoic acid export membrane protein